MILEAASILQQSHVTDDFVQNIIKQNNIQGKQSARKLRRNSVEQQWKGEGEIQQLLDNASENIFLTEYSNSKRSSRMRNLDSEPPSSGMTTPS
jgi:hypothetical protein